MTGGLVKCVVWDLDRTLWDGVLLEDAEVCPRHGVPHILNALDRRGVLHSIASRDISWHAEQRLRALGLWHLFVHPQNHWSSMPCADPTSTTCSPVS